MTDFLSDNSKKEDYKTLSDLPCESNEDNPSISRVVDEIGLGFGTILISLFSGFFFCLEAAELTMLSFVLPELQEQWNLSNFESSFLASSAFLGLFLGSIVWGIVSDRMGRKDTIVICSFGTCFFGCLSSISFNFIFFLVCEFFVGFFVGGAVVSFSFYIEFLPKKFRGITMNGVEIFWCLGVICETGLCWLVLENLPRMGWNFVCILTVSPCLVTIILAPFIPRSPRFLLIKGRHADMNRSFEWLERMNCRKRKSNFMNNINTSLDDTNGSINLDKGKNSEKTSKCFSCSSLSFDSIFMYLSIVVFYTAGSFGYYGVALACPNFFSSNNKYLGSFIVSLSEIPGLFVSSIGMATIGRKFTQVLTFLGCALGLCLLMFPNENLVERVTFGLIARGSALAATCVTWIIAQESLSTECRSFGCGVAAGIAKGMTCFSPLVVELFPSNNDFIPKIFFSISTTVAGVLCIFYPYESKGKDLYDFVSEKKIEDKDDLDDDETIKKKEKNVCIIQEHEVFSRENQERIF